MMNKSSLACTVGGKKALLVMVPYLVAVIECLKQEEQLNSRHAAVLHRPWTLSRWWRTSNKQ